MYFIFTFKIVLHSHYIKMFGQSIYCDNISIIFNLLNCFSSFQNFLNCDFFLGYFLSSFYNDWIALSISNYLIEIYFFFWISFIIYFWFLNVKVISKLVQEAKIIFLYWFMIKRLMFVMYQIIIFNIITSSCLFKVSNPF